MCFYTHVIQNGLYYLSNFSILSIKQGNNLNKIANQTKCIVSIIVSAFQFIFITSVFSTRAISHARLPNFPKSSATPVNYWCGKTLPAEQRMHKWISINALLLSLGVTLLDGTSQVRVYSLHCEASSSSLVVPEDGGGRENHHLLSHSHDDVASWILKKSRGPLLNCKANQSNTTEPTSSPALGSYSRTFVRSLSLSLPPLSYLRLFLAPSGRNRIAKSDFATRQRSYILSAKCICVLALSRTARSSPLTSANKTYALLGKSNVATIMSP